MVRVSIKNQANIVNWQSEFKTMAEADAWIAGNVAVNAWGKAGEYTVEKQDISAEVAAAESKIAERAAKVATLRASIGQTRSLAQVNRLLDDLLVVLGVDQAPAQAAWNEMSPLERFKSSVLG